MVFIVPKSKQGNAKLMPCIGASQIRINLCLSLSLKMMMHSLPVSIHHLQVLSHTRTSVSPESGYTSAPSRASVSCFLFPHYDHHDSFSNCPSSLLFHRLFTLGLHWEELKSSQCWKTFSTYFLGDGEFQLLSEVLDILARGSLHCCLVGWPQNQTFSLMLWNWLNVILYSYPITGKHK